MNLIKAVITTFISNMKILLVIFVVINQIIIIIDDVDSAHTESQNKEESLNLQWRDPEIFKDINHKAFSDDVNCPSSTLLGMIEIVKASLKNSNGIDSRQENGCVIISLLKENQKKSAHISDLETTIQGMKADFQTLSNTVQLLSLKFNDQANPKEARSINFQEEAQSFASEKPKPEHSEALWFISTVWKSLNETNLIFKGQLETIKKQYQQLEVVSLKLNETIHDSNQYTKLMVKQVNQMSDKMATIERALNLKTFNEATETNPDMTNFKYQVSSENGEPTVVRPNLSRQNIKSATDSSPELIFTLPKRRLLKLSREISPIVNAFPSNDSHLVSSPQTPPPPPQMIPNRDQYDMYFELKDQLKFVEEKFETQLKTESSKARESEDQLFTIISNEVQRAKKLESDIGQMLDISIYRLTDNIVGELNRAKLVEESLDKKISDEITRASSAESMLLYNLNEEIKKRGLEKEQEFQNSTMNFSSQIQTLYQDFKSHVQNETHLLKSTIIDELNSKLENQTQKLSQVESDLKSTINDEIKRSPRLEMDMRDSLNREIKRAYEAEEKILSTVLEEVSRASRVEKSLIQDLNDEVDRAKRVENSLKQNQDVIQLEDKVGSIQRLLRSESSKVDTINTELNQKASKHLKILEELNKKIQSVYRFLEKKISEVEEETKKYSPSKKANDAGDVIKEKSGEKPTASTWVKNSSPGIMGRIIGMFRRSKVPRTSPNNNKKNYIKGTNQQQTATRHPVRSWSSKKKPRQEEDEDVRMMSREDQPDQFNEDGLIKSKNSNSNQSKEFLEFDDDLLSKLLKSDIVLYSPVVYDQSNFTLDGLNNSTDSLLL